MTTATTDQSVNGAATGGSDSPGSALGSDHGTVDGGSELPAVDTARPRRPPRKKSSAKTATKKATHKADIDLEDKDVKRTRRRTPLFPAATFEDALELASAIYKFGSGQPVRRISLFDDLGKSPDSGSSRQLITNSGRYGLTSGSYKAEHLELTPEGLQAVADDVSGAARARARFKLAIENVDVFKKLFDAYVGNRLPAQAALADRARGFGVPDEDLVECIETFTVNTKYVGVLRSISGAERFIDIDTVIDDYLPASERARSLQAELRPRTTPARTTAPSDAAVTAGNFATACFYITPIGDEGSEQRKHADLFMGALVEPALAEFGLHLVRADKIGEAGMISAQIIEHIVHSKLVIVDLSFHNPNVFYELALRHAVRKPIVQISRAADKLPFDVGQVRTIVVDTADIYTLVPQLESLKAQIAAQIRKTLEEDVDVVNPLSVFAPYFWQQLPGPRA